MITLATTTKKIPYQYFSFCFRYCYHHINNTVINNSNDTHGIPVYVTFITNTQKRPSPSKQQQTEASKRRSNHTPPGKGTDGRNIRQESHTTKYATWSSLPGLPTASNTSLSQAGKHLSHVMPVIQEIPGSCSYILNKAFRKNDVCGSSCVRAVLVCMYACMYRVLCLSDGTRVIFVGF